MVGNLIRGCYESNAALLNLHHQFVCSWSHSTIPNLLPFNGLIANRTFFSPTDLDSVVLLMLWLAILCPRSDLIPQNTFRCNPTERFWHSSHQELIKLWKHYRSRQFLNHVTIQEVGTLLERDRTRRNYTVYSYNDLSLVVGPCALGGFVELSFTWLKTSFVLHTKRYLMGHDKVTTNSTLSIYSYRNGTTSATSEPLLLDSNHL